MHMHLLKLTIWQMYKTIKEVDSQVNNAIQNTHTCIYSQKKMSNEIIIVLLLLVINNKVP